MSSMATRIPLFSLPLRYFTVVARTRSVSEAARQLHVAASAVSRQIGLLEEGLGMPLFERAPRGMQPTPAGERLLAHLLAATEEGAGLLEQLRGLAGRPRVRLACTEGFAVGFLAEAVKGLRQAYPGVQFELAVVAPGQVNQMLRQGDTDLGLKYSLSPEKDASLLHAMTAPVMAVLRPGHPLARCTALTVAEAVGYPLAMGPAGTTSRSLFDLACSQRGLQYVPALEGNFSSALLSMLGERDILPAGYLTVAHAVAAGDLRAIPFTEPELQQRRLCLLAQNGRSLLPPVQALADLLVASMARYGKRKVRAVRPGAAPR
ncbi:LysR family transcriptional regulator [Alicycliphilus denitrificans]|nr:LysR family transcriptional regulator [Alicycliphilus denitrificans]